MVTVTLMTVNEWWANISIGDTLSGIMAFIGLVAVVYRAAVWVHKKNVELVEDLEKKLTVQLTTNRTDNVTLTNEVKAQMERHEGKDDVRFGNIDQNDQKQLEIIYDMKGKVTLLVKHFLKDIDED